jgi:uncharacterized protein
MIDRSFILALQEQKYELDQLNPDKWCDRKEENLLQLGSSLAQIVIGVRRSGKSTLCHKFLKRNKVNYAYINFDDERTGMIDTAQLEQLLEASYYVYGNFDYLFLDEPQNVNGWHLFVSRLLRQGIHLFITGSNSRLLSTELASHLTGRYNQVELYPLSFLEFLHLRGMKSNAILTKERAFRRRAFDEYLEMGGLPEIQNLVSWKSYISILFNSIINRDIIERFRIRNKQALRDIAAFAVSNFGREFNFKKIERQFGITSDITIKNYIGYLEQAYLIIGLNKFSFKTRERIRNKKYYLVDTSFPTALNTLTGDDLGWKLENIVFLELLRRKHEHQYDIHYFKTHYEIDFVISAGLRIIQLIQVCADLTSKRTFNREVNGLINGSAELNCSRLTIITLGESRMVDSDDKKIAISSLFDWLQETTG